MFYSNNDSYMQDLYFYNQVPNNTYMNSFANNMMGNTMNPNMQMMPNNMGNTMPSTMQTNNQAGMFPNNTMPVQNLNNLYPSIYRIVNPVVSRVVSNNNQPITEDLLNNMTDTVFNIVEGQVDLGDDPVQRNTTSENQSSSNTSSNMSSNNNTSSRTTETRQQQTSSSQTSFRNNRNESLLRDLIRILIIKELLSRNQFQRQFSQNSFYNQQPFYMSM